MATKTRSLYRDLVPYETPLSGRDRAAARVTIPRMPDQPIATPRRQSMFLLPLLLQVGAASLVVAFEPVTRRR